MNRLLLVVLVMGVMSVCGMDHSQKSGFTQQDRLLLPEVQKGSIPLVKFQLAHGANVDTVFPNNLAMMSAGAKDNSHAPLETRRFDTTCHSRYLLHDIARKVTPETLEQSLDQMLWLLKKNEGTEKKDTHGKTCSDYLNYRKFKRGEVASHLLYLYYFESTTDMVARSASLRQTHPQDLQKPEPIFCDCLANAQSEHMSEMVVDLDCVPENVLSVHPAGAVLKCSELQKDPAYATWKRVLQNVEQLSEDQGRRLAKKWKALLNDWHTFRIVATIFNNPDTKLFQFALLQDDYDLVSYMLQHRMDLIGNSFCARSVPMLQLLQQYGMLSLRDEQGNTPLHHIAKHGRLAQANVIDFYLKNGVDPLAKNGKGLTALDLLVQHSYRFDGYESKLQKFIDILLKSGARGRHMHGHGIWHQPEKTVQDVAQETHAEWQLPATALVLGRLQAQERSDARFAQFVRFRKAFAITYPRVEGDTPLHTVVKMILQKHDRLTEFIPSFKEMSFEERLLFFKTEFETIEALLRQGYDFGAQNSQGKTIFHELCADWSASAKQRDILYRKLLRLIFTTQTELATHHREGKQEELDQQQDIIEMSNRLHEVLALKDNQYVSPLEMVCNDRKPCTHEEYWCVGSLLLGTTCTFKNRLIGFLRHDQAVEVHETYKWVLGLYEDIKTDK